MGRLDSIFRDPSTNYHRQLTAATSTERVLDPICISHPRFCGAAAPLEIHRVVAHAGSSIRFDCPLQGRSDTKSCVLGGRPSQSRSSAFTGSWFGGGFLCQGAEPPSPRKASGKPRTEFPRPGIPVTRLAAMAGSLMALSVTDSAGKPSGPSGSNGVDVNSQGWRLCGTPGMRVPHPTEPQRGDRS